MTPVRIGIMGYASIARRKMLPAMAALPGMQIAAIASRDPDKAGAAARAHGCRAVKGYEALLGLEEVEAVYIPLPNALHATWIESALSAGKHVLAEKPLTTGASRTGELIAMARSRGLVLMENMMFPYHRQHAAVQALVTGGAIGGLRTVHASFGIPRLPDDDIRYNAELGGGALMDAGVYPVRAAMFFLGEGDIDVLSAVLTSRHGQQVDSSGQALLCAGGVGAQVTFGLDHSYRSSYELWGSEGRIVVERAYTPPAGHVPVVRLERQQGVQDIRLVPDDQVANSLTAFAAAIRSRQFPGSGCALRQAVLVEAIRTRARLCTDHAAGRAGAIRGGTTYVGDGPGGRRR